MGVNAPVLVHYPAQAGSINACRTSPVERFCTNAATPDCFGFAFGSSGSVRFSSTLSAGPNSIGPIHSRTT